MSTRLYRHAAFGAHEVPPGHMERQGRYLAVDRALEDPDFSALERHEAQPLGRDALSAAHGQAHIDMVFGAAPSEGMAQLDPDTFMGQSSLDAALRGAGAAVDAVRAVWAKEAANAFVASRPPGHHTTADRAMGFCLFNNAALAAHEALSQGASRVAVVDFDVHHGNGTQDIVEADERIFFASSHEWPQYPGTGRDDERGRAGNCHNATLETGSGSLPFRRAWGDRLLPALRDFAPDLIVISAGFDAHEADPVGGLTLGEGDYAWITNELAVIAKEVAACRIVSILEGGYDLDALGASAATHVRGLLAAGA